MEVVEDGALRVPLGEEGGDIGGGAVGGAGVDVEAVGLRGGWD